MLFDAVPDLLRSVFGDGFLGVAEAHSILFLFTLLLVMPPSPLTAMLHIFIIRSIFLAPLLYLLDLYSTIQI